MNIDLLRRELMDSTPFTLKNDARVLVIGLGGVGIRLTAKTKEMFIERYGKDAVMNSMTFYCIDTDDEKPNAITREEWLRVGELSDTDEIKKWRNPNISKVRAVPWSKGGGQRPMVGRWKLFSHETKIIKHLDEIIAGYKTKLGRVDGINKVYVVVLASICGGTGCGTFIDLPYFVRKSMYNKSVDEKYFEFYGILELPDSKVEELNPTKQKRARANAYAALNELYLFMDKDKVSYTAKFADDTKPFKSSKQVFHQCFLVSNYTVSGVTRNSYKKVANKNKIDAYYLDMAIPEVINTMITDPKIPINPDTGNVEEGHHDFDSGMDNTRTDDFKPDPRNKQKSCVATIGVSRIEIPLREYILAIFARIFQTLENLWKKISDVQLIMVLVTDKLANSFNLEKTYDNIVKEVQNNSVKLNAKVLDDDYFLRYQGIIPLDGNSLKEKMIKDFNKSIDQIYLTHGPFVAEKVFESQYLNTYLKLQLKKIKNISEIKTYKGTDSELKDDMDSYNNAVKKNKKKEIQSLGEKLTKNKKDKAFDSAKEYIYLEIFKCVMEDEHGVLSKIEKQHMTLFENVTKMLDVFNLIFNPIGINTSSEEEVSQDKKRQKHHIYKWNSSNVSKNFIDDKMKRLFWKKISLADNGGVYHTQEDVFRVLEIRGNETEELLFSYKSDHEHPNIKVRYEGKSIDNVSEVIEIVRFIPGVDDELPLGDMINDFLGKVKNVNKNESTWKGLFDEDGKLKKNTNKDKDLVFQKILEIVNNCLTDIINKFKKAGFENMIIYGNEKAVLGGDYSIKQKNDFFTEAIECFNQEAEPSFPVISDDRENALNQDNYAVFFVPKLSEQYENLFAEIPPSLIDPNSIELLPLEESSIMIATNFYFGYNIGSYNELDKCKEAYDDFIKSEHDLNSNDAIGLYIAEGDGEGLDINIRKEVEKNPILPLGKSE